MKIHSNNTQPPLLSIIACQHGDEPFGLEVINALRPSLPRYPGLQLIVANEEALARRSRGIDTDLNRSFPGNPSGNHEERLAHRLLSRIGASTYVLDIHTSVSDCGRLLPIATRLNERTRALINLLDAPRILHVQPPLSSRSLIDQVEGGLSLEFQKSLANTASVQLVAHLVDDLFAGRKNPAREREVYTVTDVLPADLPDLATARDFDFIEGLQCYPVLINRQPTLGNQGLVATSKEVIAI